MSATKTPVPSPIGKQREAVEQARRERVHATLANPPLFGDVYLAPFDPIWKQSGPLPRVAREVAWFLSRVKRGVVFTPPEFLKTTIVQTYGLWLTARYAAAGRLAELTGMFFSEEQQLAERNMSVITWHVENNPLIRADFVDVGGRPILEPDPDEDKWTDSAIILRRPGKVKDPTWQAKGLNAQGIQGARIRHLIGDDVITPASAHSLTKQTEAVRLWDEQITTRVVDDGQAVVCGNFNNARDAMSQIARRKSYAVLRRPSLHVPEDRSQAPDDPTDPTAIEQLPEKWPRRRLNAERAEKPNRFKRIHLLDERADVGERLKVAWLTIIPPEETPTAIARWYLALDPAPGGEGEDLDFFNVTVGALHGNADSAHLDLAISHDVRIPIGEQAGLVAAYHDRFNRVGQGVAAIGISKVALDRYFGGALAILRPDLKAKLVPISIGSQVAHADKRAQSKTERLEALGPYAESGWLRIWQAAAEDLNSSIEDRGDELSFLEQWRDFPQIRHDDKLDGADILCRTALKFGHAGQTKKATLKVKTARRR